MMATSARLSLSPVSSTGTEEALWLHGETSSDFDILLPLTEIKDTLKWRAQAFRRVSLLYIMFFFPFGVVFVCLFVLF